jgi:hypothetical protein
LEWDDLVTEEIELFDGSLELIEALAMALEPLDRSQRAARS